MPFPSPATNGQRYEAGGYVYQYNSAKRTWTKVGVAANVVTTTPSLSTNNVTSSNVTANAVTVGNVTVTGNTVSVGNTSVTANGVTVGNVILTSNAVAVGNTSLTANGVSVGNVALTGNGLSVGNVALTSNGVSVGNTSVTANGVSVGNVSLTSNGVSVGNVSLTSNGVSVGNVSLTSNGVSVGNVSLTSNGVSVGNVSLTSNGVSVGNVSLTSEGVTVGNVSLTSNGVSVGNVTLTENAVSVGNTSISDNAITTETVTANTVSQANAETGTTTTLTSGVLSLSNSLSNTTTTITSNSITSPTFYGNLVGSFLGTVAQVESLSNFTTSNLAEGSNLYFTNTRVVYALTAGNGVNITANGMITVFGAGVGGNVTSVNEQVGDVTLRTANIPESTSNLYFTNARAVAAFVAGPGISINANGYIVSTAAGGGNASGNTTITVSSPLSNTFFSVRTTTASGNTLPITRTSGYGTADDWFNDGDTFSIDGYSYTIVSIADASDPNGNATFTIEETLAASASAGTALFKYSQFSNDVTKIVVGNGINLVSSGNTATISIGSGGGAIVEYVNGQTGNVQLTTANIPEYSSNLYFTNTRVVYALTAGNGVNITANGMITVFGAGVGGNVTSVNQLVGDVTLRTANIPESTSNLYFTNARVYSNIFPLLNTNTVTEGANLYFTNTRAVYAFTPGSGLTIAANGLISSTASVSITQSNTQSNASLTIEPGSGLTQSNTASGVTSVYGSNVSLSNSQSNTSVSIDTSGVIQSNASTGTVSVIGAGNVALSNTLSNTSVSIQSTGVAQSNTTSGTNSTISSSVVGLSNTLSNTSVSIQSSGVAQSNTTAGTNSTISSSVVGLSNTLSNTTVTIQSTGVSQSNTTSGTTSTVNSSTVALANTISNTSVSIQSTGVTQANTTTGTVSVINAGNVALTNTQSGSTVTVTSDGIVLSNALTGQTFTLSSNISTSTVPEGANLYFTNSRAIGAFTAGSGLILAPNGLILSTVSTSVQQTNVESNTTVSLNPSGGLVQSNLSSGSVSIIGSGNVVLQNTIVNVNITIEANGIVQNNQSTGSVSNLDSSGISFQNTQSGAATTITSNSITSPTFVGNLVGTVSTLSNFTTSNLAEGANLYFTNTRAIYALTGGSGIVIGSNGLITANITSESAVLTTDNVTEGANLYFTNSRAIGSLTGGSGIVIGSNGLITANIASVSAELTTDNIAEGANLYFTNTRVVYALSAGNGVNITANGMITVFGGGFSNVTSVNQLTGDILLSTANIPEYSSNLYFTNTRVVYALTAGNGVNIAANGRITVFGAGAGGNVTSVNELTGDITLTTSNINEGSNLYFTNTRSIGAFTAGPGIILAANGYLQANVAGGGGETNIIYTSNVTSVNGANGDVVLTTANIAESGNLYFTNTRAISALTAGSGITIAANGRITVQDFVASNAVNSVNGQTGNVVLTTSDVNEGSNLYFTNTRAVSALTAGSGIVIAANGLVLSTVSTQVAQSNTQTGSNVVLQPSTGLTQSNTQSNTTTTLNSGSLAIACTQVSVNINLGGLLQTSIVSGTSTIVSSSNVALNNTSSGSSITFTSEGITLSNTQTGQVRTITSDFTTASIPESGNLYFTNARVYANVLAQGFATNSSVTAQLSAKANTASLTTANVSEVTNLYFTNTRAIYALTAGSGISIAANGRITSNVSAVSASLTTSNIAEGANLYFTNTRAIAAFTNGSGISIAANGRITAFGPVTGNVTSVNGLFGEVNLDTGNVFESGNLYFTNARVYSNVIQLGFATTTYVNNQLANLVASAPATLDTLSELATALGNDASFATTVTNSIATKASNAFVLEQLNLKANVSQLTTANITESGSLYFTNTRAIGAFTSGSGIDIASNGRITSTVVGGVSSVNGQTGAVTLTTASISELTNLYFTNSRSRAAFTAGQNISIAANGRITANVSAIAGNYDFGTFLAPASQRFRLRRGLESDRTSFVPLEGELIYVTDTKRVYVGDGTTAGGILVSSITQDYDGGAPTTIIFDDTLDGGFYDTTSFDDSLDLGSP